MPGEFTVEDYQALQKKLGLERVIIVQPNAYADDNSLTVASMKKLGKGAKGVGVVKADVKDAELERLTKAGIVAVRIMTLPGGMLHFDVMDQVVARVHPFGWHANIQLDGRNLPKFEAQIKRLPGKFVIDHTGKFLEPVEASQSRSSHCNVWSIPDAAGSSFPRLTRPPRPVRRSTRTSAGLRGRWSKQAPERMLWASNWPHPGNRKPAPPDDQALLDLVADWAPSEKDRHRMLVDNPAELYGY